MPLVIAGWWQRVAAVVIDAFILIPLVIGLALAVNELFGIDTSISRIADSSDANALSRGTGVVLGDLAVSALAVLIYSPPLMARWNGQTLGKRAMRIRVVRVDGRPVDFNFAVVREVAVKALLIGVVPFAAIVDYLCPLFDRENRALHDMLVRSRVVKAPVE
jgi:uncharacterized RDD family membrane protein YckC